MSSFIINPNKRDGYPVIDDNTHDFGPTQTTPYPKREFYTGSNLLDGYPIMDGWKSFSPVQDSIYPSNMFRIDDSKMQGYPSFSFFGDFSPVQDSIYPSNMFRIDASKMQGYPSFSFFGDFKNFGAFEFAENLTKITIPRSVRYICDYAFWGCNNLKKVRIHPDCVYFSHSFPEECEIQFYEENE